jgi:hypothetical protein
MPDKKVVDDYYSQIDSCKEDANIKEKAQQPTLIAKKKIIVKKSKIPSESEEGISLEDQKNDLNNQNKKPFLKDNSHKSK